MRPRSPVEGLSLMGTILNSKPMVVWVEGSDKRKLTNGLVLKSFYDNETDQWVGPDDTFISTNFTLILWMITFYLLDILLMTLTIFTISFLHEPEWMFLLDANYG